MPKTRPPYSPEFRRQIVDLARSGRDPSDLAREFEPSAQAIRKWVAQTNRQEGRAGPKPAAATTPTMTADERDELTWLRRENKQLRVERDILSRAATGTHACVRWDPGLVRARDRRRAVRVFQFMSPNQAVFPVTTMARVLGVSRAGYGAPKRPDRRPIRKRCGADLLAC